jgi:tetratricopeptide (TPR) repeat protein
MGDSLRRGPTGVEPPAEGRYTRRDEAEARRTGANMPPQAIAAQDLNAMQRMALMRQARAAVERNPKNVDALLAIAGILGAENSPAEAIDWLQKALSVRKKDVDILRRLVAAASEARQFLLARKYARKLCELAPRQEEHHRLLAKVLEEMGQPRAAIAAYEKAEQLRPGDPDTLVAIGRCHGFAGEHEQALLYYRKALAADPGHAMALYSYGSVHKFKPGEEGDFVSRIDGALDRAQDPVLRASLLYSAGKALDDSGRHGEAFQRWIRANAERAPQEPVGFLAPFVNMSEAVTRDYIAMRRDFGLPTDRPVFIVGMPRSGTTLTESLIGAHSKVTAGDELMHFAAICKKLGRETGVSGAFRRNLEELTPARSRELAQLYLDLSANAAGDTPHFTDKLPHNFQNVGIIALLFPNAKIIHVRRHPLDNCISLFSNSMREFHNSYKTDLTTLGIYYRQYMLLMEHWRKVLPGKMHEVFYEDLVANTEYNARAMIAHLGLDWEDGVMERANSQRSVRTLSSWQVRQPVYSTSSGKWRRYEEHLGPLMEALGPHVQAYEKELAAIGAEQKG